MAERGKFVLNKRTGRHILRDDDGVKRQLVDAAEEVADDAGPTASVETYMTDRMVAGVVVGATEQARDGVATKSAQRVVSRQATGRARAAQAKPFLEGAIRSRAQWRFIASHDRGSLRERAGMSPRYSSLPERVSR